MRARLSIWAPGVRGALFFEGDAPEVVKRLRAVMERLRAVVELLVPAGGAAVAVAEFEEFADVDEFSAAAALADMGTPVWVGKLHDGDVSSELYLVVLSGLCADERD